MKFKTPFYVKLCEVLRVNQILQSLNSTLVLWFIFRSMGSISHPSYFHILQYVQVSSGLNHYFVSYRVHRHTDRHTHTKTDPQTHRQTDGHEYSIVAVDKPQL